MAAKENRFMTGRKTEQQVSLRDITNSVNANHVQPAKTDRRIEDIDISLIDVDDINEQLFGYEDLKKIETSFKEIGNKSVIYVYERENGRYLCYAGNQRLIASKNRKDKKITCVIDGPEPTKEERIEQLIFMNAQRVQRPYYIAQQLKEYEKLLRSKGKTDVVSLIEEKFGYKKRMQQTYKQILKLTPELQNLFKREDIPFAYLLQKCNRIPAGKESEFAYAFNSLCEEEEPSTDLINKVFSIVTKKEQSETASINRVKYSQILKTYKNFMNIELDDEGNFIIDEKKKEVVLAEVKDLQEKLLLIEKACE